MLDRAIAAVADAPSSVIPVGASPHPVKLSQQAAIVIAPIAEGSLHLTDGDFSTAEIPADGLVEDWSRGLSPPRWLTASTASGGCGALDISGSTLFQDIDDMDADTNPETYDWYWAAPDNPIYVDQMGKLVHAFASCSGMTQSSTCPAGGHSDDPRIFSIDIASVGSSGEWTIQGTEDFRTGVMYLDNSAAPTCDLTGSTYEIDEDAWWAELHDHWTSGFPADTSGRPNNVHLIGKLLYPSGDDTHLNWAATQECYAPAEYSAGMRGTATFGSAIGTYSGRRNGIRYNSFGTREHSDKYFSIGENAFAKESESWIYSSYQVETWFTIPDIFGGDSLKRPLPGNVLDSQAYGVWDWEESIRYLHAGRFSLIDTKGAYVPGLPWTATEGSLIEKTKQHFCTCALGGANSACATELLAQFLRNSGPRIRLLSKSYRGTVDASSTNLTRYLSATVRFENFGNTPLYTDYQLEFAFVPRASFDPNPGSGNFVYAESYPRRTLAPPAASGTLATLRAQVSTGKSYRVPLSAFDPRGILPAEGVSLPVTSSRSGQCANDATIRGYGSILDQTLRGAHGYPVTVRPVAEATFDIPVPVQSGDWTILYRLDQIGQTSYARRVPLDMPTGRVIGDGSQDTILHDYQNRWVFFGFVTTVTP